MARLLFICLLFLQLAAATAQHPLTFTKTAGGIGFKDAKGSWLLELYPGNIIKTTFTPAGYQTNELVSNAVIAKPLTGNMTIGGNMPQKIAVLSPQAQVIPDKGMLRYFAGKQPVLIADEPLQKDGYHVFTFRLMQGEKIFGGGERALPLDRRGYRFSLYNAPRYGYEDGAEDLNFSVPFFLSSNGYGIFFDNPSKGYADIGKSNPNIFEAGFVSGQLNYYIIPGKNAEEILQSYTRLTGRQPLPPRWAFGNFMSRFGYRNEAQVKEIYGNMRSAEFTVDAVIFDLFWFGDSIKGTMGNLDWTNKTKWPDPEGMIADFAKDSVKTILITEPFVLQSTPNYEPSKQFHATDSAGNPFVLQDFYFGKGGLIDVFRNDAQDWFWSKYDKQIKLGVAGWWGDLGEPEKHPPGAYHNLSSLGFSRKFAADEVHNLYGHYWSKMLFEKYRKHYPSTRLFHLNRSGFAGSQRYSIFPWTGDVHRNWKGFKAQLPILLGMSLSGLPYTHSDAGGFAMGQMDPELYTRWLQFAAFTPIFRPHGTAFGDVDPSVANIPSEPVFYPEPYKSIVQEVMLTRFLLTPYIYTLAYEQQQHGRPLMRPMFYHYPSDKECYAATDQYMWGPQLLVAPVLEQGAAQKKLYLPAGSWYDYTNGKLVKGGQWTTREAGISDIPFYVKEGAFVPMLFSQPVNLSNYSTAQLMVLYVPSEKPSSFTLYDDDGSTPGAVEKQQFELITFRGQSAKARISVNVSGNGGRFRGRPASRIIRLQIPGISKRPAGVTLNGKALADLSKDGAETGSFFYNELSQTLQVRVAFTGQPLNIQIQR